MKRRYYRIIGLSKHIAELWLKETSMNAQLFETSDYETFALVKLTIFEAIKMRYDIIKNNLFQDHLGLKLKRMD